MRFTDIDVEQGALGGSQERIMEGTVRRGTGGGFSACCFARNDNCESDALRNLNKENRLCLFDSSCVGGVSGRWLAEDARL